MSKLKVAVVGAGGIAHYAHLPNLKAREDAVEIAAIVDASAEIAGQMASLYGVAKTAADISEVLDEVDAVLICVPTFLHADIAVQCLRAGKAVFCEKPLTRTLEQADAIADAMNASGAKLQVGFVRRFDEEWLTFHKAIQEGKVGKPVVWRDVQAGSGPANLWFNIDEKGGGPFLDGSIHNIDFALSMFGPAQWAFCHGRTLRDVNTAIDTGTATIHFQSGDELLIAWSWGLPFGSGGGSVFELFGSRGLLNHGTDESGNAAYVINHGDDAENEVLAYPPNALSDAYKAQIDEFIEVARGDKEPRAGFVEGRESVRVALAILESARSGEVVKLA